jgi:hypothetical protein
MFSVALQNLGMHGLNTVPVWTYSALRGSMVTRIPLWYLHNLQKVASSSMGISMRSSCCLSVRVSLELPR